MGVWQTIDRLTFLLGSLGFGFIMGYWTNKTVKMAEKFSARELGLIVSMILGAAVTQIVGKSEAVIGIYLIGVFMGVIWHYKKAMRFSGNKWNSHKNRADNHEQGTEKFEPATRDHHVGIETMVAQDCYAPSPIGDVGALDGEPSDSDNHSSSIISDYDRDLIRQVLSPIITPNQTDEECVVNEKKVDSDKNLHNDMAMANLRNVNENLR